MPSAAIPPPTGDGGGHRLLVVAGGDASGGDGASARRVGPRAAGGVHTILSGRLLELRANAGMLSPDGRFATFDAAANGYVRGEGCGIVVLKRLAEAQADGDRIWGVIRGTALNQDGASPGLTVPSGPAQEKCIRTALARAGIEPSQVDYLEAHGTGTPVGDPIRLEATAAAYGRGRDPDRPLLIGSVKTNIGHLESAAGVAGVIKTILAMKHGVIPKHLHFRTPNPEMDWDRLPLRVTAEPTPWPLHDDHPPTAGVSGFGWSGTNAHVVLEGYGVSGGAPAGASSGHRAAGAARPEISTTRCGSSPRSTRSIIAAVVVFLSVQAYAQSDETCVAYMEADAVFEPTRRKYQSALAAANNATDSAMSAWEAAQYAEAFYEVPLHNAENPAYASLPDLTDHESAKRDLEIALAKARAASATSRKAWDIFAAIVDSIESARTKRNRAYLLAYKGPTSTVGCGPEQCGPDSVLAQLIKADRERCRERLER